MRNLGLALVLIGSVTAPHAALAKKHAQHKKPRAAHKTKKQQTVAPARHDEALIDAVAAHQREEKPVMTSTVVAPPAAPNAPLTMTNQIVDEEVPGSRKRK